MIRSSTGESYWRCPSIYADECWFSVGHEYYLIVGLLINPPGCLLEPELQNVRQDIGFLDEVHAVNLRGDKMLSIAKEWMNKFSESSSIFRAVIIPKKEPEFTDFCDGKDWRLINKGIHLTLTYSYPGSDDKGIIKILRPRIFLDEHDNYRTNREEMLAELRVQFQRHDLFMGQQLRRFPNPILELMNSKSIDCIQLCDLFVAAIHWQLEPPSHDNKREFLEHIKTHFGISNMAKVAKWDTTGKINVWPFKEAESLVRT